jgi:hypothetical protein
MGRLILTLLLVACAGGLVAQNSANLSGSVPNNRRITYLYQVDFSGSAQSWTLNVSLNTNAVTGLIVRLIDIDAFAASALANPTSINEGSVLGMGTASATLNGSYADVHYFAVEIETAQGTTASDYTGSITSSVGTVGFLKQDQFVLTASGVKLEVDHFAFRDDAVPQNTTIASSLELDFGSSSHTAFIRLEGIGTAIDKIEFIDTTGGTGTVLATFSNPTAGQVTSVPMTHSGKATLRVNVQSSVASAGTASWAVTTPSSVSMSLVGVPDGGSSDNNCSTDEGTGWLVLLGLAAALLASLRLRREA